MKYLLILSFVFLVACGGDNPSGDPVLVVVHRDVKVWLDGTRVIPAEAEFPNHLTFAEDGSGEAVNGTEVDKFTYKIESTVKAETWLCPGEEGEINTSNIEVDLDGEKFPLKLEVYTGTCGLLSVNCVWVEDGEGVDYFFELSESGCDYLLE